MMLDYSYIDAAPVWKDIGNPLSSNPIYLDLPDINTTYRNVKYPPTYSDSTSSKKIVASSDQE